MLYDLTKTHVGRVILDGTAQIAGTAFDENVYPDGTLDKSNIKEEKDVKVADVKRGCNVSLR